MRLVFAIILVVLMTSCEEAPLSVTRKMKTTADSLYKANRVLLSVELDSLCAQRKEDQFDHLVDSVMEVRKKERDRILNNQKR